MGGCTSKTAAARDEDHDDYGDSQDAGDGFAAVNPMASTRSPYGALQAGPSSRLPSFHIVPRSKDEYAAAAKRTRGVSSVSMATQESLEGESRPPPSRYDSKTEAMLADDDSDIEEGSVIERIDTTLTPFRPDGSLRGASFNNLVGLGPGASMYLSPQQRDYLTRAASRGPSTPGASAHGHSMGSGTAVVHQQPQGSPQPQRGGASGRRQGGGGSPGTGMKRKGTGVPYTYAAAGVGTASTGRAAQTPTGVEASSRAIAKTGSGRVGGGKVQAGRGVPQAQARHQQTIAVPAVTAPQVRTAYTRSRSQQ